MFIRWNRSLEIVSNDCTIGDVIQQSKGAIVDVFTEKTNFSIAKQEVSAASMQAVEDPGIGSPVGTTPPGGIDIPVARISTSEEIC